MGYKMLSIIIPTLNEEKFLPRLLESIKAQNFKDYEIIVADANSKDRTVKIAKEYGCKVVQGGLPARGRNNGARVAKGDILLFLDADTVLPPNFLNRCLGEFNSRRLDCATCCLIDNSNILFDHLATYFGNFVVKSMQYIKPHAFGACIFVKREWHNKIDGFNEELFQGEDHNYVSKVVKARGKFRVLKSEKLNISMRGFKKGRVKAILKCSYVFLHRIFIGELKKPVFKYFREN